MTVDSFSRFYQECASRESHILHSFKIPPLKLKHGEIHFSRRCRSGRLYIASLQRLECKLRGPAQGSGLPELSS